MLTNAQWKDIIVANLNDDRIFSIQAFITRLAERQTYGGGINQYRIKDTVTDTWVTSLQDFMLKIDANSLVADYFYHSGKIDNNFIHPTFIKLSNFDVYLDENSSEDSIYMQMFGKSSLKKIILVANYLADSDTALPLKIIDIRLVTKI